MASKVLLSAFNTISSASCLLDSILMKYRGHSGVLKSYEVKAIFNLAASPMALQPPPWPPSLPQGPLASAMAPSHPHSPSSLPHGWGAMGEATKFKNGLHVMILGTIL